MRNTTEHAVRGFSLVELLVAISIIALISTAIAVRFSAFDSVTLLRNLGYEVALTFREAQVYSLSVLGRDNDFDEVFGVYTASGGREYYLFRDGGVSSNDRYDPGEEIQENTMNQRFVVNAVCYELNGSETCGDEMSVGFERPNFEPILYFNDGSGWSETSNFSLVRVKVAPTADPNTEMFVEIGITGQISVVPGS